MGIFKASTILSKYVLLPEIIHEPFIPFHFGKGPSIKPLDEKIILESVEKTRCIVSAEEHNFLGGLGESISRVLSKNLPLPQEFVATKDTFGESGTPAQLMEKYGLSANSIVDKVKKVISRK